jgi:AraC-like DNA-binding protein
MRDENRIRFWPRDAPPAGASVWPRGVGRLTGHGESRYVSIPDGFCLHLVVKGRGTIRTDHLQTDVRTGEMFCLWPGVRIEYFGAPENPWHLYWLNVVGKGMLGYAAACGFGACNLRVRPTEGNKVKALLREIFDLYQHRREEDTCRVLSLLYEIVPACAPSSSGQTEESHRPETLVEHAVAMAGTLLQNGITVSDMARALHVSRTTLFRAFHSVTGVSPVQYLSQARIRRARELLSTTSYKISAVAGASGFTTEKYFLRKFRQVVGITPSEYRKSHQSEG